VARSVQRDTDVPELIASVVAARRRLAAAASSLTVEQGAFRPDPDTWSIRAIIEHLVLASQNGINMVWQALEGLERGQPAWKGEHTNRGLSIEEIIEKTWPVTDHGPLTVRTSLKAPKLADPADRGPLDFWLVSLEALQQPMERLGDRLTGVDLESVIFPHFMCGPMDARQRFEFLAWHMLHHLQQIDEEIKADVRWPE
jgi:hypothetical protein